VVSFGYIPLVSTGGIFFYLIELILYFVRVYIMMIQFGFRYFKKNSWLLLASWSSKKWTLFNSQILPREAIYLNILKGKNFQLKYSIPESYLNSDVIGQCW